MEIPEAFTRSVGKHELKVREANWTDPTLTLAGDGWALSLTCPWTVSGPSGPEFTWETADVEGRAWDLIGVTITGVAPKKREDFMDPVFSFSNGMVLEVTSDTELDPWNMHIRVAVFLGPLRAKDWK